MWDLLLTNGVIITVDGEHHLYDKGYIGVEGDTIAAIGPMEELGERTAARVIDCKGHAILPGLVDGHGHGGHCLIRTLGEHLDDGWEEMAETIYYRCTDPEFWRAEGALAAAERLKFGTTTAVSMVGSTSVQMTKSVKGPMSSILQMLPNPIRSRSKRSMHKINIPTKVLAVPMVMPVTL